MTLLGFFRIPGRRKNNAGRAGKEGEKEILPAKPAVSKPENPDFLSRQAWRNEGIERGAIPAADRCSNCCRGCFWPFS